jgi:hypothetical protein
VRAKEIGRNGRLDGEVDVLWQVVGGAGDLQGVQLRDHKRLTGAASSEQTSQGRFPATSAGSVGRWRSGRFGTLDGKTKRS